LEAGFRNPPAWAKPFTWWHWMGGNSSKEGITADLESMKQAGIGGAHIFDAGQGIPDGPVQYNSPLWRDLIAHAASEGKRLGLEIAMHNCSGWSSTGGPWVKPEDAMKKLTWNVNQVPSGRGYNNPGFGPEPNILSAARGEVTIPRPPCVGGFYRDIAVLACPMFAAFQYSPGDVGRFTGMGGNPGMDFLVPGNQAREFRELPLGVPEPDGSLKVKVPDGEWTIVRLGYTLTGTHNVASRPTGEGLEVDKLSSVALDHFIADSLEPLFKRMGDTVGKSFNTIVIDSYETGPQNWTAGMIADFKRLRGYDLTPYLPALAGFAVKDQDTTKKFLFDYRRTLADLWGENYSGHYAQRLKQYGLQMAIEPYGNGSFDPNTYVKPAGLYMGEYWMGEGEINASVKHTASIVHVYGKRLSGAESLTAGMEWAGWRGQPRLWKPYADRGFANGVNRIVYHEFAQQPWASGVLPGMTMGPWGSNVERTQTFWADFMPAWDEYLTRCQYILQSGQFVADVCVFSGEGEPQELGGEGYSLPEVPKGYDFDYCGIDPLWGLTVQKGLVQAPNGPTYKVLALPDTTWMSVPLARKLRDLVLSGAVLVGPKPLHTPSLQDGPNGDAELADIANDMWGSGPTGERSVGKGRVFWGRPVQAVLDDLHLKPDFQTGASKLSEIHRHIGTTDAYFVASFQHLPRTVECTFRVKGMIPELWNAETGATEVAPVWRASEAGTTVQIPLEADGSVFVVFRYADHGVPHVVSVDQRFPEAKEKAVKLLDVEHAEYGVLDQPGKFRDVTKRVAAAVQGGSLEVVANNDEMGGDPAYMVVKALRVTYKIGDEEHTATVNENETLTIGDAPNQGTPPAYELQVEPLQPERATGGRVTLGFWGAGACALHWASGNMNAWSGSGKSEPIEVRGPWLVRFPAGWDAPAITTFDKLISWTESPVFGIKYFSGTATYSKSLEVPAHLIRNGLRLILDLGDVRECARVRLNGKLVGSFWKAPFRVDITRLAHAGANKLEVEVTNLWVNRLIGDEQFPDDMGWEGDHLRAWPEWFLKKQPRPEPRRKTFTTWRHNTKDTPELPSGLLGPVYLRPVLVLHVQDRSRE
jgi:hypothetical protein